GSGSRRRRARESSGRDRSARSGVWQHAWVCPQEEYRATRNILIDKCFRIYGSIFSHLPVPVLPGKSNPDGCVSYKPPARNAKTNQRIRRDAGASAIFSHLSDETSVPVLHSGL